jgi:hypothetical protein
MPRIDDYINARNLAVEKLSEESFEKIAERSGFEPSDGDSLQIPFLDRIYRVSYTQFEFTDQVDSEKEVPIQEQVLILHYLMAAEIPDLSRQWVSYRGSLKKSVWPEYFRIFPGSRKTSGPEN